MSGPMPGSHPPAYTVQTIGPPPAYTSFPTTHGSIDEGTNQAFYSGKEYLVTSFDDYMHQAVFSTVCCFWPLGVFAILKSSQARNAMAAYDIPTAHRLADESRRMSNIAISIGSVAVVVMIVVVLAVVLSRTKEY